MRSRPGAQLARATAIASVLVDILAADPEAIARLRELVGPQPLDVPAPRPLL
jgi:hypothetical protein